MSVDADKIITDILAELLSGDTTTSIGTTSSGPVMTIQDILDVQEALVGDYIPPNIYMCSRDMFEEMCKKLDYNYIPGLIRYYIMGAEFWINDAITFGEILSIPATVVQPDGKMYEMH